MPSRAVTAVSPCPYRLTAAVMRAAARWVRGRVIAISISCRETHSKWTDASRPEAVRAASTRFDQHSHAPTRGFRPRVADTNRILENRSQQARTGSGEPNSVGLMVGRWCSPRLYSSRAPLRDRPDYGVRTRTEAVDLALRRLAGQPMTHEEALAMRGAHAVAETPVDTGPRDGS